MQIQLILRWLSSYLGSVVAFTSWHTLLDQSPQPFNGEALQFFDEDVRRCFSECTAIDTLNVAWQQAQLSLCRGSLGFRSLAKHSSAAYISSLNASSNSSCKHLVASAKQFNELVSPDDALVLDHLKVVQYQKSLSVEIEDHHLGNYLSNKARLLGSISMLTQLSSRLL